MDVPPLDPMHILAQVAFVFAAAFVLTCVVIFCARAYPPRTPDATPIDGHLRSLFASPDPFVLILAAPPSADDDVAHLWNAIRGAVRAGDFMARLDEHRIALVVPSDRAGGRRLVARLSMLAQGGNGPAFGLGVAYAPADGADPANLTAVATDRLVAALQSGRPVAQLPPMTETSSPRQAPSATPADVATRQLDLFVGAVRRDAPVALLYAEIDQLGKYGEQYGQEFAKKIFDETSAQARASLRGGDFVTALDDRRLVIALHGQPAQARVVGARLVTGLRRTTLAPKGATLKITVSIGLACMPEHADNTAELADMAYAAMNVAKGSGGNTLSVFEPGTPVAGRTHVPRDVF